MAWYRLIFFNIIWWIIQICWLWNDRVLQDGDEKGHVEAMELFKLDWQSHSFFEGLYRCGQNIWMGNYGEYPPLFAAIYGTVWALLECCLQSTVSPYSPLLRLWLLCPLWISSMCMARIVYRYKGDWEFTWMIMLCLPLGNGIARHYMPENFILLFTSLSMLFSLEFSQKIQWWKMAILGITVGLGLLSKQTFIIIAPLVIFTMFLERKQSPALLQAMLWAGLIAIPWYLQQFSAQSAYLLSSSQAKMPHHWIWQILFYPSSILLLGWGLLISLGTIIALFNIRKHRIFCPLWLKVWLCTLVIFMILPKQYPRLLLGWLPCAAILMGLAFQQCRVHSKILISSVLFVSTIFSSWTDYPQQIFHHHIQPKIDDGCPQVWLRPPQHHDLWMNKIADMAKNYPFASIEVLGDHEIDCQLQSTHSWNSHLDPFLRMMGLDRDIKFHDKEPFNWNSDAILIIWKKEDRILVEPIIIAPNQQ